MALFGAVLALVLVWSVGWGDPSLFPPRPGDGSVPVYLVSNGFHSGLILPARETQAAAGHDGRPAVYSVAARFGSYDWIEFGRGEARFYRETPTIASINWRLGLSALFGFGNNAVLHVVGVEGDPQAFYGTADLVPVQLSTVGFSRLLAELDRSFAVDGRLPPQASGSGLYGPSLFYPATGTFSIMNVCNHWTAHLLAAAGVPVWPLAATLPGGLLLDLAFRSGLSPRAGALPEPAGTH